MKIGPGLNSNCFPMRGVDRDAQHVGRQHVAGELDAVKAAIERPRQGLGERGLADAGNVFDQQVAAREHGDQGQAQRLRPCRG